MSQTPLPPQHIAEIFKFLTFEQLEVVKEFCPRWKAIIEQIELTLPRRILGLIAKCHRDDTFQIRIKEGKESTNNIDKYWIPTTMFQELVMVADCRALEVLLTQATKGDFPMRVKRLSICFLHVIPNWRDFDVCDAIHKLTRSMVVDEVAIWVRTLEELFVVLDKIDAIYRLA